MQESPLGRRVLPVSAKIILAVSATALFRQKRKRYDSRFRQKKFGNQRF